MGIYRDGKTKIFHANFFDSNGKRCRPSLHTKDKRIAEVKFAEIRRQNITVKDLKYSPNIPISDFEYKFNKFIELEKAPDTVNRYKISLKYLKDIVKIKQLSDITPQSLQNLKEALMRQNKGVAGINRNIKALKAMMHQAEKWDLIAPQKWSNVSKLREKKGRIDFYSEEEIQNILDLMGQEWQMVILLGCRAGLRRSEIAVLKWKDVDFTNNQIYIAANKTDNYRYVPLTAQLREALKTAQKSTKTDFVVPEIGRCPRKSKYFLTAAYNKKLKEGKIRGSMHTLRHTFASHLVQAGVDLYSVSKLLGHTSIKTTEIYAHLAPKTLQEAVKKLP